MKKREVPVIVLLLCVGVRALSLPEAQQLLLDSAFDVRAAEHQVRSAQAAVSEALSAWQPTLSVNGSASVQSKTPRIFLPPIQLSPAAPPVQLPEREIGTNDRVELGIDVTYPLFTGMSRYHNVKGQRTGESARKESLRATQQALSLQLGALYFGWELASALVSVREAHRDQLERYAQQIQDRLQAGAATPAQAAQVQAQRDFASSDLIAARNSLDSLQLEIAFLLGVPDSTVVPQPYPFAPDSSELDRLAHLSTRDDRPELRALELSVDQISSQRSALAGRRLPSLAAFAGYRYAKPGINLGGDEFMDYGLAGVQASWTVWDGKKIRSQDAQLAAAADGVGSQVAKQRYQFAKNLRSAQAALVSARSRHGAAWSSASASDLAVEGVRNQFEAGTATQSDYLTALDNQERAHFSIDQSNFRIRSSCLQIRYLAGEEIRF